MGVEPDRKPTAGGSHSTKVRMPNYFVNPDLLRRVTG